MGQLTSPTLWESLRMETEGDIPMEVWNRAMEAIRTAEVMNITNGTGEKIAGVGTSLKCTPSAGGAAVTYQQYQEISLVPVGGDTTGGSGYYLTLQPGDINGNIFPTISGTPMWQMVATTVGGVTSYAFPTLLINKGDQVWLKGTVSGGILATAIIDHGATPPDEDDSTTVQIIGTCDSMTGAWTQLQVGNPAYVAVAAYWNAGDRLIFHDWTWPYPSED